MVVPDTAYSRDYLDFGKGFYLTPIYEQAVRYAQRFIRRQRTAWLNSYVFEFESSQWRVLQFDSYDKRWLDFVAKCRAGNDEIGVNEYIFSPAKLAFAFILKGRVTKDTITSIEWMHHI